MKILVIEDYAPLRNSIVKGFREADFAVDATGDGDEGLWFARSSDSYDVIVLDLMLPGVNGLTILKRLREQGNQVHILILTAKDTVEDRVKGLNLGADDYLIKPFAFEELLARVRSLVRRKYGSKSAALQIEDLEIDTEVHVVRRAGRVLDMSAREYVLLEFLALRAGQVVTRTDIWDHIYDFASEPNSNVIDVFVGNIRRKLETGGLPRIIHTKRGIGYVLGEPV